MRTHDDMTSRRASGRARRRVRVGRSGMTLIEIMIVVLIVAVAATGLSYGFGALNRTQLRAACMRLTAASRFAYNRAISRGTTVRIALDFEHGTMAIEEGHGRITLARMSDTRRQAIEEEDEDGSDSASAVDPWEAARARLADTLHPSFGASPFQPISGRRYTAQPVAEGVDIERLITPHEAEPRTRGTGHIYFFPHGQTEHAVVWLSDGGETVFSVEIHPLSGRARVRASAYEPEELMIEGDESTSEVRD
ncbi:MAG: prepilin-type N-terminal cleavage/methylation domain-containing protein [Sandaracinaceae bacterium]|nr:prepilin-type N-terminal cleavage/methylation domain-containing protein [Sandaracinaceae bacterium]